MLDVRTLFVCIMAAHTAMAICLAVALGARLDESRWPGLRAWTAGMGLQTVGWLVRFSGLGLPEILHVSLGLALVSFGFGFYWRGVRFFAGQPAPLVWSIAPGLLLFAHGIAVFEDMHARLIFVNTTFALQYAAVILPAWRCREGVGAGTRGLFMLAAAAGSASIAARALHALYDPGSLAGLLTPHPVNTGALVVTHISGLVLVFALMGMYMQRSEAANRKLANTDPLTGALNRRSLERIGNKEAARAEELGAPVSVVMLDIDHFKRVNDNYGHATGDAVLQRVAQEVRHALRSDDTVARLGGEEFCVTLPGAPLGRACEVAERIRRRIETIAWDQNNLRVTVSVGVAERKSGEADLWSAIKRADTLLYAAKSDGRNRVYGNHPLPATA